MKLQNIHNNDRFLYLFLREDDGSQVIQKVDDFYPYYYELYEPQLGSKKLYKTFDGKDVYKIECIKPSDLRKFSSSTSYESDIKYTHRYLIDKVPVIEKSRTKFCMYDIEIDIIPGQFPHAEQANRPVSMIYAYNNHTNKLYFWGLNNYEGNKQSKERQMLTSFLDWWKAEAFDLILAWNHIGFDYHYLFNRAKKLMGVNLAEYISPIGQERWTRDSFTFPAGTSILCLMELYAKLTLNRKQSYALDKIAQSDLEEETWGDDHDFNDYEITKKKCRNDVARLVKLDRKFDIISQVDETRREAKTLWEDLTQRTSYEGGKKEVKRNATKAIDQVFFMLAKEKGVILPNKPLQIDEDKTNAVLKKKLKTTEKTDENGNLVIIKPEKRKEIIKEIKDGAYREAFKTGRFKNLISVDLSGAYPTAISDFCLDIANLRFEPEENTVCIDCNYRETGEHRDTYYFVQDTNAILPTTCNYLLERKNEIKKELSELPEASPELKEKEIAYAAAKARVNSVFGGTGLNTFRLSNKPVFNSTTFLIRDLLHYIIEQTGRHELALNLLAHTDLSEGLDDHHCELYYVDTDGLIFDTSVPKKEFVKLLNALTQQWAIDKYGKSGTNITFDYEGTFSPIYIHALCHYASKLDTGGRVEDKTKGMVSKRSNTNKFVKKILKEFFQMVLELDGKNEWVHNEDTVLAYLKSQLKDVQEKDLLNFAFPAKLSRKMEQYDKKEEIYVRAIKNSLEFGMKVPDLDRVFYWVHVEPYGYDEIDVENYYRMVPGKREGTTKQQKVKVSELNKMTEEEKQPLVKKVTKKKKHKDVLAFTEDNLDQILSDKKIDWKTMIQKNVVTKLSSYFQSLGWDDSKLEVLYDEVR